MYCENASPRCEKPSVLRVTWDYGRFFKVYCAEHAAEAYGKRRQRLEKEQGVQFWLMPTSIELHPITR